MFKQAWNNSDTIIRAATATITAIDPNSGHKLPGSQSETVGVTFGESISFSAPDLAVLLRKKPTQREYTAQVIFRWELTTEPSTQESEPQRFVYQVEATDAVVQLVMASLVRLEAAASSAQDGRSFLTPIHTSELHAIPQRMNMQLGENLRAEWEQWDCDGKGNVSFDKIRRNGGRISAVSVSTGEKIEALPAGDGTFTLPFITAGLWSLFIQPSATSNLYLVRLDILDQRPMRNLAEEASVASHATLEAEPVRSLFRDSQKQLIPWTEESTRSAGSLEGEKLICLVHTSAALPAAPGTETKTSDPPPNTRNTIAIAEKVSTFALKGAEFVINELDITWSLLKHNCLTNIVAPTAAAFAGWSVYPSTDPLSFVRVLMAFLWSLLALYWVDMPNQLKGVEVDRLNKPSRPIPRGILTVRGGYIRWAICSALYLGLSIYYHVFLLSVAWVALMVLYVFTPFLHVHWFTKNVVFLSLAFFILLCGAWNFVAPMTSGVAFYLACVSLVVSFSYIVQDLRDAEGDTAKKRRTLPLVWGDHTARIFSFIIASMTPIGCLVLFSGPSNLLMWPGLVRANLSPGAQLAWNIINAVTCFTVGIMTLLGSPKGTDQLTYSIVESHFVFLAGSAMFFTSL